MGVSSFVPAGVSLLAIGTSFLDQKSQAEAIRAKQDILADNALYSQNMTKQEVEALDIKLGSILDQSAIQSLKDEATLTAMVSASGLSGNISEDVVAQATIARRERDTSTSNQAEDRATQLLASMVDIERQLKQGNTELTNQLRTGSEAFLSTLGAATQGLTTGLSFLNPQQQNDFFGR